jgi:predicted GNAT family acetyltransferase
MCKAGYEPGGSPRCGGDARRTLEEAPTEEPRIEVRSHGSIDSFRTAAVEIYQRDPIAAVIELKILRRLSDSDPPPLLLTVWDGGALAGAALQTPPFPLLCGGLPESAINHVVAELAQSRPDLTGVRGPRDIATRFADTWCTSTGALSSVSCEQRLYRLNVLRPPMTIEGEPRPARESDIDLLVDWLTRFHAEALANTPGPVATPHSIRTAKQAGGEFLLWALNSEPVSMAAVSFPAAGVSGIGPVYTRADKRGHGFGSAVTAAAANWAYAAGAKDVVLFADLANPVSNTIYQRIGFRSVIDFTRIDFTQPV